MQIILVSRGQKGPKTLDFTCRRMRCKMVGMAAVAFIGIAGVGAALALALSGSRSAAPVVARNTPEAQRVADQADAQRELNALAVKLGQLQAQSIRLNALGERLTQVGKLDDGEFNFNEEPAQGGPEIAPSSDAAYLKPAALGKDIDLLSGQFDAQQAQLEALHDMLLDRKIESSLRPTGMPVNGYISSFFGGRPDPFSGHAARHTGIDIAAPKGTPVTAVAEGMVTFAGQRSGYGDVVEIDHGNGYMTRYAHNSAILAKPGQHVRVGDEIARAGSTGRSTGSHVHFEVWYHDRVVNPLAYVRSHR
ncbi:M23 family metallopeptidase [Luteibacter anthropi]|uniref:M23 family metallopeptidase n=1 Tax=Luteibacter anthropi TaxID=564369 RepID=UPI0020328509|nr:M23 family metallopeptidase [Luteibacter anthropi]URX64451.1 M23 family metallopeptidase [Luteibacter anthropi]